MKSANSYNILAIESASEQCLVALASGQQLYQRTSASKQQHSQFILPFVVELLSTAELTLQQLDLLAYGCGPGSFTGIRLAASIVQGLAFASQRPIVAISSLQLLAQAVLPNITTATLVIVLQDAKMQAVYCGIYYADPNNPTQSTYALLEEQLITTEEIATTLLPIILHIIKLKITDPITSARMIAIGDGWTNYQAQYTKLIQQLPTNLQLQLLALPIPQAADLLQLAAYQFITGNTICATQALPKYLHNAKTWHNS